MVYNQKLDDYIKCKMLYGRLPLMSELHPKYNIHKVNCAFTGLPLLEMYCCISFKLCMLPSANRRM